jgi:hypothetical protein
MVNSQLVALSGFQWISRRAFQRASGPLNGRDQEQGGDAGEGEIGDDRGGFVVVVRNKMPVSGALADGSAGALPGSGLGLVSPAERVALAGGTLAHGPDGGGDFALTAAFPWEG